MGKSSLEDARFGLTARKLRVCGHPMRLKLLCAIRHGEPCVSDLWKCLDESQPVVSQHLAALKREGIVTSHVEGNRRRYSISDPVIDTIIGAIGLTVNGSRQQGSERK